MPIKLTPAQKEVTKLYRRGLRAIRTKPEETRPSFLLYLRHAFRSSEGGGGVSKRNFSAIEYLLRRGDRMMVDIFEAKGVKRIGVSLSALQWWKGEQEKIRNARHRQP